MNLAEAIYQHSLRLPEAAAREVLDFITAVEQRYAVAPLPVPETPVEADPRQAEARREALAHLAGVRIAWAGKPIPARDALYDEARDGH